MFFAGASVPALAVDISVIAGALLVPCVLPFPPLEGGDVSYRLHVIGHIRCVFLI